jgi:hypothetical protein
LGGPPEYAEHSRIDTKGLDIARRFDVADRTRTASGVVGDLSRLDRN